MTVCAVIVIGHVDHGKTALVRALTGIETDRLKEERARGLSIALGFAYRDYPSGSMDFIDAPGHEDFIRAMVSGATGARAALLVVSAVDGVERQSLEHVHIAVMLGIEAGVVAVTKSDLLPESERALRRAEIEEALERTGFAGRPIVFCSSITREGLGELDDRLDALIQSTRATDGPDGFFLPIDRVFSAQGLGTVVTGTLQGGAMRVGEQAVVQPGGRSVQVRGLQARGEDHETAEAGRRWAINLRGAAVDQVRRGDVVCLPERFVAAERFDVEVRLSPHCMLALKHMDEVRVMFGTSAEVATVRPLGRNRLEPGASGFAQLRFRSDVVGHAGQRGVLRRLSPAETIGGFEVMDPAAPGARGDQTARLAALDAARRSDVAAVAAALAEGGGGVGSIADVIRLGRGAEQEVRSALEADFKAIGEGGFVSRQAATAAEQAYLGHVDGFHSASPLKVRMPVSSVQKLMRRQFAAALIGDVEAVLGAQGALVFHGDGVARSGRDPLALMSAHQRGLLEQIEGLLRDGGLAPPDRRELFAIDEDASDLVDLLVEDGRAVSLYNHAQRKALVFHAAAVEAGGGRLRAEFPSPATFRTGEAREVLETTRKFIVPLLEHFDALGWTVRDGDVRTMAPDSV